MSFNVPLFAFFGLHHRIDPQPHLCYFCEFAKTFVNNMAIINSNNVQNSNSTKVRKGN